MPKKRDSLVDKLDAEAAELLKAAKGDSVELKERQAIFREVVRYLGVKNKLDLFDEETDGGIAGFARELASPTRIGHGRGAAEVSTAPSRLSDGADTRTTGSISGRDLHDDPPDNDDPGGAFAPTADSVGSGRLGGDGDDDTDADDDGSPGDLLRPGGATNGLA